MTTKKDDCCGADGGIEDDLSPMRGFGSAGPGGYTTGPSHADRADFREGETTAEDATKTEDTKADDNAAVDDADTKPGV